MKHWTKEEDQILITHYPKEGTEVFKKLPGRTPNAIKNRAQNLGVIHRREMFGWTEEELSILKEYYPIEGKRVVSRLPGRTINTIQVTAHRLGVKRRNNKES